MGAGLRASKLGYIIYCALTKEGLLSPSKFKRLLTIAYEHMDRLTDPSFIGQSNHAYFQIHGLMALSQALPKRSSEKSSHSFIKAQLERLLLDQFGQEGMHLEHSPGYHIFSINTIRRMIRSGWYGDTNLKKIFRLASNNTNWLVFPDGTISKSGDSEQGNHRYGFINKNSPIKRAKLFSEAGYAIVRGKSTEQNLRSMLFVTAGHHSNVHKHADDLSFELYDKDRFWIVDTGKFSYSRLDWRRFTNSARAHNTIVYSSEAEDNGLRKVNPVGGMLQRLERSGGEWIIEGKVERPQLGVSHRRLFRYTPNRILIVEDELLFDTPREFSSWLHLANDLEAHEEDGGWRLPGARIAYEVEGASLRLQRIRGQVDPELQGWVAKRYHEITPSDALAVHMTGQAVRLVTTITFE